MKLALYISALALSLLACNNGDSVSSNDSSVEEIEGMILVHSGTTTLGSNDAKYKASERPAMKVKLDYDFYLFFINFIIKIFVRYSICTTMKSIRRFVNM